MQSPCPVDLAGSIDGMHAVHTLGAPCEIAGTLLKISSEQPPAAETSCQRGNCKNGSVVTSKRSVAIICTAQASGGSFLCLWRPAAGLACVFPVKLATGGCDQQTAEDPRPVKRRLALG